MSKCYLIFSRNCTSVKLIIQTNTVCYTYANVATQNWPTETEMSKHETFWEQKLDVTRHYIKIIYRPVWLFQIKKYNSNFLAFILITKQISQSQSLVRAFQKLVNINTFLKNCETVNVKMSTFIQLMLLLYLRNETSVKKIVITRIYATQ